jgi:prepilin-type N-terminal cleavage/methylation domain-containing protein
MAGNKGFTLIELLTVISIIGILSALGITSFKVYRNSAAYSVSEKTLRDARTAIEASANNVEVARVAVPGLVQTSQGAITDAAGSVFLPGMMIPRNVKFTARFDPTCQGGGCEMEHLEVSHCFGLEHISWTRFGDGIDVLLENVAGGGCS